MFQVMKITKVVLSLCISVVSLVHLVVIITKINMIVLIQCVLVVEWVNFGADGMTTEWYDIYCNTVAYPGVSFGGNMSVNGSVRGRCGGPRGKPPGGNFFGFRDS